MQQAETTRFCQLRCMENCRSDGKTPEAALTFMQAIVPAARARALDEQAEIQNVINHEQGNLTSEAWDWAFYAEQVRREKYALDEVQLKPYFAP